MINNGRGAILQPDHFFQIPVLSKGNRGNEQCCQGNARQVVQPAYRDRLELEHTRFHRPCSSGHIEGKIVV